MKHRYLYLKVLQKKEGNEQQQGNGNTFILKNNENNSKCNKYHNWDTLATARLMMLSRYFRRVFSARSLPVKNTVRKTKNSSRKNEEELFLIGKNYCLQLKPGMG